MKKAYVTLLNSENYLKGFLALYESLNSTNTTIPLVAFMTSSASFELEQKVRRYAELSKSNNCKIVVKKVENAIFLDEESLSKNEYKNWNNTFDKLMVFGLTEYDKLILLDSDMMITNNIDFLFEKENFSSVIAGKMYPGNESWRELNSGLIVFSPSDGMVEEFKTLIPQIVKQKTCYGDQDVINRYLPDWGDREELHLSEQFNLFFPYVIYYQKNYGYSINKENKIYVVHFIGNKPWMGSNSKAYKKTILLNVFKQRSLIALKLFNRYKKFLKIADKKLKKINKNLST